MPGSAGLVGVMSWRLGCVAACQLANLAARRLEKPGGKPLAFGVA